MDMAVSSQLTLQRAVRDPAFTLPPVNDGRFHSTGGLFLGDFQRMDPSPRFSRGLRLCYQRLDWMGSYVGASGQGAAFAVRKGPGIRFLRADFSHARSSTKRGSHVELSPPEVPRNAALGSCNNCKVRSVCFAQGYELQDD